MKESSLSRLDVLSLGIIAATLTIIGIFYADLPDQIPVHWNSSGEIDGFSSRFCGVFMMPLIAIGTFILFKILPPISPRGFTMEESRKTLDIIQVVLIALSCAIGLSTVLISLGYELDMPKIILIGTGLMLIATGNVMSKVRKNFFVGIKTPWTLADDEVWSLTHRLAGRTFFAGGLFICLAALVNASPIIILVGVGFAVFVPIVYSFVVYRRLYPKQGDQD